MFKALAKALFVLHFAVFAFAQESSTKVEATEAADGQTQATIDDSSEAPTDGRVEKLEVTGSRIKRINVEGPSPVLTIDREDMTRSGYNSVADVLRDATISVQGVGRESSGSATSGSATMGLRGFGPDKVLVLLNGERLPKIGGNNAVDLNLIPFAAIERVEILKDGASAIYGSDALAGVINFITRKDYDGFSITTRFSAPEEPDGQRSDIAAVYGKNFSKGNFLAVYQYRSNEELRSSQREYTRANGLPVSTLGSPGSFQDTDDGDGVPGPGAPEPGRPLGGFNPDPSCPVSQRVTQGATGNLVGPDQPNVFCGFDYTPYSWELPELEQHSAILSGSYDINPELNVFSNVTYINRRSAWQYAPAPDIFEDNYRSNQFFAIPNATANGVWGLPVTEKATVRYRLVEELGVRSNRDETNTYGGTVGIKGYFMDTWEWTTTATYGASEVFSNGFSGYADKSVLFNLMTVSNTFNPFAPSGAKGDVSSARTPALQWINSQMSSVNFITNGELTDLGGGVLSAAFGGSANWESFENTVDAVTAADNLFGGSGSIGNGLRDYQAIFAELGWVYDQWEVQLAGRFDHFSDFGETFNPKLSLSYMPAKQVLIRGSAGTGFKAPTLFELYQSNSYGYPSVIDRVGCNASADPANDPICRRQQYRTLTGGNSNLQEETSLSWNLGTVVQPTADMAITMDWWYTEINNAIGLDLQDMMNAEAAGAPLPAPLEVRRDGGGTITEIIALNVNLAKQRAEGLEFGFNHVFHLGAGMTLVPSVSHSHILRYEEEPFPGLGIFSKLDDPGRPRWRNTSSLTFNFLKAHSVRVTAKTIAGQFTVNHLADRSDQERIPTYTEYDLNYRWQTTWDGEFNFGVRNLLDADRPLDFNELFPDRLNRSLYDPFGRTFFMSYTQNF